MTPPTPEFVDSYRRLFSRSAGTSRPIGALRFVVLDCETTGLNPKTDRLVTIGAVAVADEQIVLEDAFEVMLRVRFNTAAVTVHGVTREETREGMEEPEAIQQLIGYLGDAVIVGHHIRHDVETINAACRRHFDFELLNSSIDAMNLALLLEQDGAFGDDAPMSDFSLDGLCRRFDIKPYGRHTASGDAFLTAQVFLRLLRLSRRFGRTKLESLQESPRSDD